MSESTIQAETGPVERAAEPRATSQGQSLGSATATSACERCKRRKASCDRALPACQRCAQVGVGCVYQHRRRPGFAAGHRQVLEQRIQFLESENRRLVSVAASDSQGQSQIQSQPRPPHAPGLELAIAAPASHTSLQQPTPSTAVAQEPGEPSSRDDRVFQATYTRTSKLVERCPPFDLVVSSVSVFFRHVFPWLPFLDVSTVISDVATAREPSLLLHAIFGASLPYLFDPRLDQIASDSFWKYTKRRILAETAEEPSYASLEACTILTLDLSGMTNGPQVWTRLAVLTKLATLLYTPRGQSLRQAVQAGDATPDPSFGQHAKLFWAIYALDVFISLTTSQAPTLPQHSIDAFLPTRTAPWSGGRGKNSPESQFLTLLGLLDVARLIHADYIEYLAIPTDDDDRCRRWLESHLEHSAAVEAYLHSMGASAWTPEPPFDQPLAAMTVVYGHALLINHNGLLEFSKHAGLAPHLQRYIDDARAASARSAQVIWELTVACVDTLKDQLGWPFAWTIWVAARYHIVNAYEKAVPLSAQFDNLLHAVQTLGRYWQISKKYWSLLRRAANMLGRPGTALPRLMVSMVNLSVPTSDLEDEFRVDPVLSYRAGINPASSHADEPTPVDIVAQFDSTATHLDLAGNDLSNTWFNMPLYASSGYYRFGTVSGDEDWDFLMETAPVPP